ncbi:MAG TPA: hypothetical protein VJ840_18755 [Gemmatimonadaceae bacterium]|nr:hypothetical protein [Gemmatimonadaceae bacterium]
MRRRENPHEIGHEPEDRVTHIATRDLVARSRRDRLIEEGLRRQFGSVFERCIENAAIRLRCRCAHRAYFEVNVDTSVGQLLLNHRTDFLVG